METKLAIRYLRTILSIPLGLLALSAPASADEISGQEPLTIGTSYRFETLGATRHVNVVTPTGYADADTAYPVVVVLDGGIKQDFFLAFGMERWNQLWQRSAPAIFVGIETIDRQRELLPPTVDPEERKRYPTAGASQEFRTWLVRTVLPAIRARYRTDGRAFLIGESAAGHFVVETWIKQPGAFDGYAALSPSLQWNGQALSRSFHRMPKDPRPPLFVSLANEGGATEDGVTRFAADSEACFADRRTQLHHATTLHGLFPEALQYLLPTNAAWLKDYGLIVQCVRGDGTAAAGDTKDEARPSP